MKLKPIGLDTQLTNVLEGISTQEQESTALKIAFVAEHVNNILEINSKYIYDAIVKGENIYYNLDPLPEWLETVTPETPRKYYYPIKYATIKFFNNLP